MTARAPFLGWDGAFTAMLSIIVMLSSGGLTLLLAALHVRRVGAAAPITGDARRAVVLGHRSMGEFRRRLLRGAALAEGGMSILLLGGVTRPGFPSEAAMGRQFLIAQGLKPDRIATEDASRHTLENLRAYRERLLPGSAPDLLVTSRTHLARSLAIAEGLGLTFIPCAAEAEPRLGLGDVLREAMLLHWYHVGATFARLTRSRAMLARIS